MEFLTKWNTKPSYSKPNSGEIKVEKAGYIPIRDQINQMLLAGRRLSEYRKELYDTMDHNEEIDVMPTRTPGYDMADATQDNLALNEKFNATKEALEKSKKDVQVKHKNDKEESNTSIAEDDKDKESS